MLDHDTDSYDKISRALLPAAWDEPEVLATAIRGSSKALR